MAASTTAVDRRPTAQQIAELIELVRRDPASPIALQLAEAYMHLGRPHDAIGTLEAHLQVAPNALDGRVLIARAYADLHQWREAQGELLRVVKLDRSSARAFTLLGEVLLRRDDFERAIPVLQHAQMLDPTSPDILAMLRRARNNEKLEPAPPIPQALPPRGESGHMVLPAPQRDAVAPAPATPARVTPAALAVPAVAEPAAPRGKQPTLPPPPQQPPKERPRVIPQQKVTNAAAASLRQSAAAGEVYLSELIHGGLLDIAGVRVPVVEFDLRPDRRWGRSTRRAFVFLFVVVVLGSTGGVTWKWWSTKQRAEALDRTLSDARLLMVTGELDSLETARKNLSDERDKEPSRLAVQATLAEVAAFEAVLYGPHGDDAAAAIAVVGPELATGDPGATELVLGKAALAVARLRDVGAGKEGLADGRAAIADNAKALDELLAKADDNRWARWLRARIHLAAGERGAARADLKRAADGDDGLIAAMLDLGDVLADDGDLPGALAQYDRVLAKVANHPLAILGRALARAEANVDAERAIREVGPMLKLKKGATRDEAIAAYGERIIAYRDLALALAFYDADGPRDAVDNEQLALAKPIGEPRFWTALAWLDTRRGARAQADAARAKIISFAVGHGEDDPLAQAIDAERALATGQPDRALAIAAKLGGTRGRALRVTALLELGRAKDALAEANELVALTKPKPDANNPETEPSREAALLLAQTKLMLSDDPDKDGTGAAMYAIANRQNNKIGRHTAGMAFLAIGKLDDATNNFKVAVETPENPDAPNPVIERSLTWYADALIEIARAKPAKQADDAAQAIALAKTLLEQAQKANPGYLPLQAVRAKLALYQGDPDAASKLIEPVVRDLGNQYPLLQLVWAEILATRPVADKDKAQQILESIKDRVKPASMVGRVAALVDPKLPETLGVPGPLQPKPTTPPPGTRRGRH